MVRCGLPGIPSSRIQAIPTRVGPDQEIGRRAELPRTDSRRGPGRGSDRRERLSVLQLIGAGLVLLGVLFVTLA